MVIGDNISLADVSLVVYLTLNIISNEPIMEHKPFLIEWFERIKDRKSYKLAVDDWGDKTAERRKKKASRL